MADPDFDVLPINDDYRIRMALPGDRDQIRDIARSHPVTRGISDGAMEVIAGRIRSGEMRCLVAERISTGTVLGFMLIAWTPPIPIIDLMLHRRSPQLEVWQDGEPVLDADGDPTLTNRGAAVYGWLQRAGHIYADRNGVTRGEFSCPRKLWDRLRTLWPVPLFGMKVSTVAGYPVDLGNGWVRVRVRFRE